MVKPKLRNAVNLYESLSVFNANSSGAVEKIFDDFKNILNVTPEESFCILNHIEIGPHHTFEGWEEAIKDKFYRPHGSGLFWCKIQV